MADYQRINGIRVKQCWEPIRHNSFVQIGAPFRLGTRGCAVFECCHCGFAKIDRVNKDREGRKFLCPNCDRVTEKRRSEKRKQYNREYNSWQSMKDRCSQRSTVASYKRYRDNGISVCDRWKDNFFLFLEDMGPRPHGTSLDRIDTYGNYSCGKCEECLARGWPSNCRWATQREQNLNKTNMTKLSFLGEEKSVTEWAEDPRVPVGRQTIYSRLRQGWPVEDALTIPKTSPKDCIKCKKSRSSA